MNDRPVIVAGLLLALGVFTSPVWYNVAKGTRAVEPAVVLPKAERTCVAPRSVMRTSHMTLLASWREDVVRRDARTWTFEGRHYDKSLTQTCMRCHANAAEFCDRCHAYAAVAPSCKNCHVMTTERPGAVLP